MIISSIFLVFVIFEVTLGTAYGQYHGCGANKFTCGNGQCIDQNLICNRRNDCADGSDEIYALCFYDTRSTTKPPQSKESPTRHSSTTKSPLQNRFGCSLGDFSCLNGECISQSHTCDGSYDCSDGSDESPTICPDIGGMVLSHIDEKTTARPASNSNQGTKSSSKSNRENVKNNRDYYEYESVFEKPSSSSSSNSGSSSNSNSNVDKWHDKLKPCEAPQQPKNGHWKLHRSLCDSRRDCEVPPQTESMEPGTYLVYNCNKGYSLNGHQDVLCGPGGQWITEPTCEEIKCKYLSDSATEAICIWNNVAVSCEIPVPIGTSATLRCREGFIQEITYGVSYKNTTCESDGKWSPDPIKCVKKPKRVKLVLEGDMILED